MFENLFRGEHLLIILAIVALMFPHKLANLGGSLGSSIRDFKKALRETDERAPAQPAAPKDLPEQK